MSANTECLVTGCFRRPPGTCLRNLRQNENRRIFVDAALTHTSTFPCFTSGPNITLCPDSICRVIWSSQARPTRLGITSTSSLYGEPKDQASSCTNHVRVGVPSNQQNLYPHLYFTIFAPDLTCRPLTRISIPVLYSRPMSSCLATTTILN